MHFSGSTSNKMYLAFTTEHLYNETLKYVNVLAEMLVGKDEESEEELSINVSHSIVFAHQDVNQSHML